MPHTSLPISQPPLTSFQPLPLAPMASLPPAAVDNLMTGTGGDVGLVGPQLDFDLTKVNQEPNPMWEMLTNSRTSDSSSDELIGSLLDKLADVDELSIVSFEFGDDVVAPTPGKAQRVTAGKPVIPTGSTGTSTSTGTRGSSGARKANVRKGASNESGGETKIAVDGSAGTPGAAQGASTEQAPPDSSAESQPHGWIWWAGLTASAGSVGTLSWMYGCAGEAAADGFAGCGVAESFIRAARRASSEFRAWRNEKQIRVARSLVVFSIGAIAALAPVGVPSLGAPPAAAGAPDNPSLVMRKARQLERVGQLRAAEQLLRASLGGTSARADSPQIAGCLELLASIYRESGALRRGPQDRSALSVLLEAMPCHDPVMVVKRQEIAVSLAQNCAGARGLSAGSGYGPTGAERFRPACDRPNRCWESRVYTLQARIEQKLKDGQAARRAWSDARIARAGLARTVGSRAAQLRHARSGRRVADAGADRPWTAERRDRSPRATACASNGGRHGGGATWPRSRPVMPNWRTTRARTRTLVAAIARLDKHEEDKSSAEYAELVDRLALVLEHREDHAAAEHRWTEAAAIYEC